MATKTDLRQLRSRDTLSMLTGVANSQLDLIIRDIDAELAKLFEDRNVGIVSGGTVTVNSTATSVTFSSPLDFELNSRISGASPLALEIISGGGSKTFTTDGRMLYVVLDRTTPAISVVADAATLPAVTSANQEVFLIAKRRDSGATKKIYFRNGFVISAGQVSNFGQGDDFLDSSFSIDDATDTTIRIKFDAAGTTGTATTIQSSQTVDRTWTLPDATDTAVGKATTDILSNKSLQTIVGVVVTDSTTTGADATLTAGDITNAIVRLTNASLTSVGGIPAGSSGQMLIVENQTGAGISIVDNDATVGTAANRIRTGTGTPATLNNNSAFIFTYDSTAARWILTGGSGSGSGSGELNVIANPSDSSNWVASGAGITVATTTTTSDLPLGSVIVTAIKVTPVSGTDYVRYRWTMPTSLKSKKLKVEWWQHALAGYAAGDLKVEVYKNAASNYAGAYTEFPLSTDISGTSSIPAGDGKYTTSFDADTADYYEIRLVRVAGTSAIAFANFIVGPGIQPQGAVVETPQTLSTTYDNLGTVANNEVTYTRYGSRMKVQGRVTTGTTAAGIAAIVLPSGFTLNTGTGGLSNQASGIMVGAGRFITSGGTAVDQVPATFAIFYDGSTTTKLFISDRTQSSAFVKRNGNDMFTTSDIFVYEFDVPVAEWAGAGTLNTATNNIDYLTNTNTSTSASDTTSFGYGSDGTAFVAVSSAGATIKKRVRSTRPLGASMGKPILEVSPDGILWVSASMFPYMESATERYGMRVVAGGTAQTDMDVEFGGDGANGTEAWSTYTSWKWRVTIEQPGVAVGFGLADTTTSGLMSAAAQTFAGAKTWNDVITFKAASGAVTAGSYDATGVWTLGPSTGGTLDPVLIAQAAGHVGFQLKSGSTTNYSIFRFNQSTTVSAIVGVADSGGSVLTGATQGDLIFQARTAGMRYSILDTTVGTLGTTGRWAFGGNPGDSSNSTLNILGSRTNVGAAVIGTNQNQKFTLATNNATKTFGLAGIGFQTSGHGAFCFITSAGTESWALVAVYGSTPTVQIIAQQGAYFVVGAPGAVNKVGLTATNGSEASLILTAGSAGFTLANFALTAITNAMF